MRQTPAAGEKLFVDFAGRTGEVVDGRTGEIILVQIFVAVLGASSFTYAEAVWSGSKRRSPPSMRVLPLPRHFGRKSGCTKCAVIVIRHAKS
jgi:transposase